MELQQLGWLGRAPTEGFYLSLSPRHLTAEGLTRCEALCKEKSFKPTAKNLEKVALDVSDWRPQTASY